jgi:hypothetical protein
MVSRPRRAARHATSTYYHVGRGFANAHYYGAACRSSTKTTAWRGFPAIRRNSAPPVTAGPAVRVPIQRSYSSTIRSHVSKRFRSSPPQSWPYPARTMILRRTVHCSRASARTEIAESCTTVYTSTPNGCVAGRWAARASGHRAQTVSHISSASLYVIPY